LRKLADHQRRAQGLLHELVQGHHAAHQTRALGFNRVHHAAGQGQVHRLGFANGTRQALGATGAGNDAKFDFRLTKAGVVGGNDEVAHHRQFAAAAQGKAADGGDDWFAHAANGFPVAGDEVALVHIGKAVGGHTADVGTGGKGFFAAGDDHASNRRVCIKGL
jgi:hypothetical protein